MRLTGLTIQTQEEWNSRSSQFKHRKNAIAEVNNQKTMCGRQREQQYIITPNGYILK